MEVKQLLLLITAGIIGINCSKGETEKINTSDKEVTYQKKEEANYPSHVSLLYLPPKERKKEFIRIMLPLIERANSEVLKEREFLLKIKNKKILTTEEKKRLEKLKKKYRAKNLRELLEKVNTVPVSIVLAQAAIESGWGTSRFFTEGNNAFGMYAYYKKDRCIKAKEGEACLKVYKNLYESVKDYIYNINVGWAYKEFRKARSEGADLDTLIEEMEKYSIARKRYTELLKVVIKKNNLNAYDSFALSGSSRSN